MRLHLQLDVDNMTPADVVEAFKKSLGKLPGLKPIKNPDLQGTVKDKNGKNIGRWETFSMTQTIELPPVDDGWYELVTGSEEGFTDIFIHGYCGLWAMGVKHDPKLGWLVLDVAMRDEPLRPVDRAKAVAAWRKGEALPNGWIRFDRALADKAWAKACAKWGFDWWENADGNTYSDAVQMAIFGEVVYG